jgi:hypothetical protein
MSRLQLFIAMSLLCASCFQMQSRQMAEGMDSSDSFKLCLKNHEVDPDRFISCVRTTDARTELDNCIPNDKHHEVMECMDEQVKTQPTS